MHDAHPLELALAGVASSSRGEKQNARRVAWVEHRSTNYCTHAYHSNICSLTEEEPVVEPVLSLMDTASPKTEPETAAPTTSVPSSKMAAKLGSLLTKTTTWLPLPLLTLTITKSLRSKYTR